MCPKAVNIFNIFSIIVLVSNDLVGSSFFKIAFP